MSPDVIGLRVADLEWWLDARQSGVRLMLPACHARFTAPGEQPSGMRLEVRNRPPASTEGWQAVFCDPGTWQLWVDGEGRRVFAAPRHSPPPRQIAVDAGFRGGEVVGQFGANGSRGKAVYPLQDIDMVIVANWLAETGDVIVHAAGIDDRGAGYAFVGPSGAGKSTLMNELASRHAVTVLGEDQVILRRQAGQFLVYGTPWHSNQERCSPGGVPLRKLFFLDRVNGKGIAPCGRREGIERLMQDALIPYYNRTGIERILDGLAGLVERVPLLTLGYRLGSDAMEQIREG